MKKKPIKEIPLIELASKAVCAGASTLVPTSICIYDDMVAFEFDTRTPTADGKLRFEKESYTLAVTSDARLLPLRLHDLDFLWDSADEVFRWLPRIQKEESLEIIPEITAWDNGELHVQKQFAERYFTRAALAYAFTKTDSYYSFNMSDNSQLPLIFEQPYTFRDFLNSGTQLDPSFFELQSKLGRYAASYCRAVCPDADTDAVLAAYSARFHTPLKP